MHRAQLKDFWDYLIASKQKPVQSEWIFVTLCVLVRVLTHISYSFRMYSFSVSN